MPAEIQKIIPGGPWRWCAVCLNEPDGAITFSISSVPAFALLAAQQCRGGGVVPLITLGGRLSTRERCPWYEDGGGFLVDPLWTDETIYAAIEELVEKMRSYRREARREAAEVAERAAVEARAREIALAAYRQAGGRESNGGVPVEDDDIPF